MMAGEPEQEEEENAIGTNHLGLFRAGQGGAEGNPKRCCRDSVAHDRQQAVEQAAHQEKEPEGKRDLAGSEKGKTDKDRVDVDFQLVKPGQQPVFWKVRPCQHHGRQLGHGGEIVMQAAQQMEHDRDGKPPEQIGVE